MTVPRTFPLKALFATNVANGQDLVLPVAPGITSGLVEDYCMCALQAPNTALGIVSLFLTIYALLPESGDSHKPPNPSACQRRIVALTVCS